MKFFCTKHAKHCSDHLEPKLGNDINSKLFIYKPCNLRPSALQVARKVESKDLETDNNKSYYYLGKPSSVIFTDKDRGLVERLSSDLEIKVRDGRVKERSCRVLKNVKVKRRKFNSYTRKSEFGDIESRVQRRNLSTDLKKVKKPTSIPDVKNYMKAFHRKSKFLLDCLQKTVLGS